MDKHSADAHKATHFLHSLDESVFRHPKTILGVILAITLFFASQIPGVKMYSDFADLLPQSHPYIELHNEIKSSFGGANVIIVGVEVEDGDIFTNEALAKIHRITLAVDSLPGINHNLVASVTHRNSRKVWMTPEGNVNSKSSNWAIVETHVVIERFVEVRGWDSGPFARAFPQWVERFLTRGQQTHLSDLSQHAPLRAQREDLTSRLRHLLGLAGGETGR